MRFQTLAVHAGHGVDASTGAVASPIHLSTTFARDTDGTPLGGHTYIRDSNPTQSALEEALAKLEGGTAALSFASGMAACATVLQTLASDRASPAAKHVILPSDAYYHLRVLAADFLPTWGISASWVEMHDAAALERALEEAPRPPALVWIETPSNPMLQVVDIERAAFVARRRGAITVVDNTFATPVLQNPLALGADVVMHSTTKYFGGHSDVQGGALVFRERAAFEAALHVRTVLGAVASPFNAWLVLRGLRTLACRVAVQAQNALAVARALESSRAVLQVLYPGLPSHRGHEIAARQMHGGFGGVLSFRAREGREAALRCASRVKLWTRATSLGGVESLIEHRATSEGPSSRTPDDLLRLSVGLEHPEDLIDDLLAALG